MSANPETSNALKSSKPAKCYVMVLGFAYFPVTSDKHCEYVAAFNAPGWLQPCEWTGQRMQSSLQVRRLIVKSQQSAIIPVAFVVVAGVSGSRRRLFKGSRAALNRRVTDLLGVASANSADAHALSRWLEPV
jgi:hypothetical protein